MTHRIAYAAFPAMSTSVALTGVGVSERALSQAMEEACQLAEAWEQRFSRFRPGSLLCRLNAAEGQPVPVDETFLALLNAAADAVRRTAGRFDPSVLPALEAIGYDRSIEQVRAEPPGLGTAPGLSCISGVSRWARVRIDHATGEVTLPPGMRIDFGGIAKGAFVDLLADSFAHWPGGSIDAGGDAMVWGEAPDGRAWHIGIEDPHAPEHEALLVDVPAGSRVGIATSGTHRRRWLAGGREVHHLIDPRTGQPASGAVQSVTALAESVTAAEIAAKAVLLAATEPRNSDLFGAAAAVLISANGHVELVQQTRGTDHAIEYFTATGCAA